MQFTRTCLMFCIACVCSRAHAQTGGIFDTLEARIVKAKAVYVGTISQVSTDNSSLNGMSFTVHVQETLKGAPTNVLSLNNRLYHDNSPLALWSKAKTRFLWFIADPVAGRPASESWECHRLDEPRAIDHEISDSIPIFDMDLAVLNESEDILTRARQFAKKYPDAVPLYRFSMLRDFVSSIGYSFDANEMVVPITPEFEPIAQRLIQAPQDWEDKLPLPKGISAEVAKKYRTGDMAFLKQIGINGLAYFKSEKNIALLESQLGDESLMGYHYADGSSETIYFIRKAAYDVLQKWNVKVAAPSFFPTKRPS